MAKASRRRASAAEYEQRLAEVSELLASRALPGVVVRFACQKWGLGERAGEKYVAEAYSRLRTHAEIDRQAELGMAIAGYELILRRQLTGGDLRSARATLDKLVGLLGLAAPRSEVITLDVIEREIGRLEAEIAAREQWTP